VTGEFWGLGEWGDLGCLSDLSMCKNALRAHCSTRIHSRKEEGSPRGGKGQGSNYPALLSYKVCDS